MNLFQIALRNLRRRKGKMIFMLLGLVLGSATVVAIYSTITAMQTEISRQLSDLGANIVITANSGELAFQYGGITIPELIFDAAVLTDADFDKINSISASQALIAVSPKLIGTASTGTENIVVAGTDLSREFAVKPWLRFDEIHKDSPANGTVIIEDETMEMTYERLNLERVSNVRGLGPVEVVLGSALADYLELKAGDRLELNGIIFTVLGVLQATGMAEDNQALINLAEAQLLMDRPGELTVIEIASDFNLINEEVLLFQLQNALPAANVTGVRQAVMARDELLSSLFRFGTFAGVLVFLTGSLIVILTMFAAVRERTREIGVFRAVGFRSLHIFTIISSESLLVSAFGGLAGYHVGLLAARIAGPILTGSELASPWLFSVFLFTVVGTAAAGGLAGLYPAFKAAQLDPAEALRFY